MTEINIRLLQHVIFCEYFSIMSVISGSLWWQHGSYTSCGWRNGLQVWRLATGICLLNNQSRTAYKKCSSSLGVYVRC